MTTTTKTRRAHDLRARYLAALRKPRDLTPQEVTAEMKPFQEAVHLINLGQGTLIQWRRLIRGTNLIEYAYKHARVDADGLSLCLMHAQATIEVASRRFVANGATGLRSTERASLLDALDYLEAIFSSWTDHQLAVAVAFCDNEEARLRARGHALPFVRENQGGT